MKFGKQFLSEYFFKLKLFKYKSFELVDINVAVHMINQDLSAVSKWAREKNLILNTDKTDAIFWKDVNNDAPNTAFDYETTPFSNIVLNLLAL